MRRCPLSAFSSTLPSACLSRWSWSPSHVSSAGLATSRTTGKAVAGSGGRATSGAMPRACKEHRPRNRPRPAALERNAQDADVAAAHRQQAILVAQVDRRGDQTAARGRTCVRVRQNSPFVRGRQHQGVGPRPFALARRAVGNQAQVGKGGIPGRGPPQLQRDPVGAMPDVKPDGLEGVEQAAQGGTGLPFGVRSRNRSRSISVVCRLAMLPGLCAADPDSCAAGPRPGRTTPSAGPRSNRLARIDQGVGLRRGAPRRIDGDGFRLVGRGSFRFGGCVAAGGLWCRCGPVSVSPISRRIGRNHNESAVGIASSGPASPAPGPTNRQVSPTATASASNSDRTAQRPDARSPPPCPDQPAPGPVPERYEPAPRHPPGSAPSPGARPGSAARLGIRATVRHSSVTSAPVNSCGVLVSHELDQFGVGHGSHSVLRRAGSACTRFTSACSHPRSQAPPGTALPQGSAS